MRTRVLGWGLAGALAGGPAFGQFAADRGAPPAAGAPAAAPAVAPASFTAPAATAEAPTHPWMVRPEHGEWFVCVKAYAGPNAREHATELATEIRQTHKAAAWVFERGAEDRKREQDRQGRVREKLREQYAPFLELREQMRAKAAAEGREFDDAPVKIRVPKVDYPEQWAVLVGGFKDMDTAAKANEVVRRWTPPQGKEHLLDRAVLAGDGAAEGAYLNPYAAALVVPNPAVRRAAAEKPQVDPLLAKLNENEEMSLLKCTKPVTLLVKSFSVPARTVPKDTDASVLDKLFGPKPGSMLDATAMQAKKLAEAIRKMTDGNKQPLGLESYVLHVRTGSLVCVGQYESGDDPELQRVQRVLSAITFKFAPTENPTAERSERMFDNVFPIAIPKVQ